MNPVRKSPDHWAQKVASAVVGLRPSSEKFHQFIEAMDVQDPQQFAESVRAAAKRSATLHLILGGGAVFFVLIIIVVIASIIVLPMLSGRNNPPTPVSTAPTSTPEPWVFRGHIYRGKTMKGLEGVQVHLDIRDGQQWHEAVLSATTDTSGSFAMRLPPEWEAKPEYRIRIVAPPPWDVIQVREAKDWNWDNATLQESGSMTGKFRRASEVGPLAVELYIRRVFTGVLYFQGEGAPSAAVIAMEALSDTHTITQSINRPTDTITSPLPVPFELTHDSIFKDARYWVRVSEPAGEEWAVSVSSEGVVEAIGTTGLTLTLGNQTTITNIIFAGPFPITLTHEMATWKEWKGLDTSGVITREQPDRPRNARAYWPVYLPGGSGYEIWVGIPLLQYSAVISYTLYTDEQGHLGSVVPGQITPINLCTPGEEQEQWKQGAVYTDSVRAGGLFWVVVDESQAGMPENCKLPFQVNVWKVEVRKLRSDGGR